MVLLAGVLRDSGQAIPAKRARRLLTDAAAAGEDTAFAPLAAMMEQGEGGRVDLFGAMHNLLRLREPDPAQAAALLRLREKLAAAGPATDAEGSALIRRLWGSPQILRAGLASIGFLALAIGATL
jgi:TPR repeat protein